MLNADSSILAAYYEWCNTRAQNTRRHAALCRAAAVICREALKMCGRCAARLAAIPCQSKWPKILRNRVKSPCQTDKLLQCTTIFIFNFTSFLCHQSSRENHRFHNCMSWSLDDGSENVCRHLVIKTCTASSYLARHENWAELQKPKPAEIRKKEHKRLRHTIIVLTSMLYLRNYPYKTISFRWNRTAMGDNTVTGLVSWLRLPGYSVYCYANFYCVSGETWRFYKH